MKIIHVPRRFVRSHWGGTETVILETCRQLRAKSHEVRIVTPSALATDLRETVEGIDVERHKYFYPYIGLSEEAKRSLDHKGGNLFSWSLMRALQSEPGLDILHLHTSKRLGGIVRHVARKRRIPYVVSVHGGLLDIPAAEAATFTEPTKGKPEWGKLLGMWVGSRRVFDDAAAILCLGSEEKGRIAARYPGVRVEMFPNGVDTKRFEHGDGAAFRLKHNIPPDAKVLLTVGRIDPQKNQMLAVESLAGLHERVPDAHLVLIGHVTNEAYEAALSRAIAERGLQPRVTLIRGIASSSPDLANAFHAADLFLLPSIHEPFGIVILEAWAAGLPVLATRVGGIPSFVEDGRDGVLFESGNGREMVEAAAALLSDDARRRAMAEAGRTKAREQYSWDRITDELLKIYEWAIRENPLRQ